MMADTDVTHDPVVSAESQSGMVIAIAVSFTAAASLVMCLRLYTRLFLLKTAGPDDYSMVFAQILAVVVAITTCQEANNGLGRHVWTVTENETMRQLSYLYATIIIYNFGMNVIKISFLLQYRRIFQAEWTQRVCLWMMIYVMIWAVIQDVLLGVSCLPVSFIIPSTAGWCLSTLRVWYTSSAMSIVTDFLIFLIPLPSVLKLQLPKRQKTMISGVFCLGFFVCIISIIRIFSLREAVYSSDPTWFNVGAAIWTVIELNCSILCSSLPTIRPLLARIIPGLGSSFKSRTGYQHYGSATTGLDQTKRRDKANEQSGSTEELALGTMSGRDPATGIYTMCTADNKSEDDSLDMGLGEAGRENPNRIMVTTETRLDGHSTRK